mgnify:CR=1 FL=1
MSNLKYKYSTMFDFAFSIEHNHDDPCDIPRYKLIEAAKERLNNMTLSANHIEEFGECDTYENY